MIRLILLSLFVITILKLSTVGWQRISSSSCKYLPRDKTLPSKVRSHVIRLSKEIGQRSIFDYSRLNEAAVYISQRFKDYGFEVEFQEYSLFDRCVSNIIARKAGSSDVGKIIVGAHYDTYFNPGADDNASAVAGLLELARMANSMDNRKTVEFVAFVNEEPPFFKTKDMGSFVYASRARDKELNIQAVLILEMIGYFSDKPFSQRYPLFLGPFYPNRADFIAVVGNLDNRRLVEQVVAYYKEASPFPVKSIALFNFIPGVDFSDHWSFWQNNFPAVMITDTAFYRYPYYHTSLDTFDRLDYQKISMIVEGLAGVLRRLAE